MKKKEIVKKTWEFDDIIKNGKCIKNRYFIIHTKENDSLYSRYGISVSKKVGNSVVRHHLTRLIRESYRLNEEMFNSGLDIVVVVREAAASASFDEIQKSLLHLANLHNVTRK